MGLSSFQRLFIDSPWPFRWHAAILSIFPFRGFMIVSVALRNFTRSARSYRPVIAFFSLAAALLLLAGGFLSEADRNLERLFPGGISGDICIFSNAAEEPTLFGSASAVGGENSRLPAISDFPRLQEAVRAVSGVKTTLGMVVGPVLVDLGHRQVPAYAFGADIPDYFRFFPALAERTSDSIEPGDGSSVLLSSQLARDLGMDSGRIPAPGDTIRVLFAGEQDFQISGPTMRGTVDYGVPASIVDRLMVLDSESARHLFRMTVHDFSVEVKADEADLLGASEEDLFSDAPSKQPESDIKKISDTSSSAAGGWNCMTVRLAEGFASASVKANLDRALIAEGFSAVAVDWRTAAGGSALYVLWIRGVFAFGAVLVAFLGIMSLANIQTGIALERSAEIGTMRALGASKPRVFALFATEAAVLALISGGVASLAAIAAASVVNRLNIHSGNQVLAMLTGSGGVRIHLDSSLLAGTIGSLVLCSLAATAMPIVKVLSLSSRETMEGGLV